MHSVSSAATVSDKAAEQASIAFAYYLLARYNMAFPSVHVLSIVTHAMEEKMY